MNEKIKELAIQSGAEYFGTRNTGEAIFGTLDVDLEKFAELIVKECAEVVDYDGPKGAKIKKHFGIKE